MNTSNSFEPIRARGYDLIRDPMLNKGTAFSPRERSELGLLGLVPSAHSTIEEQAQRIYASLKEKPTALEKYVGLMSLQDRNEYLYYRVLCDHLEEFMPRVVAGERPGLVFNLSYGIQGQARYTHVPSILEMVGVPYVGSGPLAHSIALDKVVTKMMLVQYRLPTPPFAVLEQPDDEMPALGYPVIVKPKHEAVSFGIRLCENQEQLREATGGRIARPSRRVISDVVHGAQPEEVSHQPLEAERDDAEHFPIRKRPDVSRGGLVERGALASLVHAMGRRGHRYESSGEGNFSTGSARRRGRG